MHHKVTIVGGGQTGGAVAQRLSEIPYLDVVILDTNEGLPQGKALDLAETAALTGFGGRITGSNDWEESGGSDIVVITAGAPRKPGMSREDLLGTNASIVKAVALNAAQHCPEAIIIMFTNPMDAMCHVARSVTGFPRERLIGMGGTLDSARFRTFIAWELGVSVEDVSAYVLGGHSEATMLPIVSTATIGGLPLNALLSKERIRAIVHRTQNGGAELVSLLKKGSAFYAPSAATADMVEAILLDKKRVLPCCVYLQGEYGVRDAFVGAPVRLGSTGIEAILEAPLSPEEMESMRKAGSAVQGLVSLLHERYPASLKP